NNVFFNIWSACSSSRNEAPPDYASWVETCRSNSLEVSDYHPRQREPANFLDPAGDVVSLEPFGSEIVIRDVDSSETPGVLLEIIAPISALLGLTALGAIIVYVIWLNKGRPNESLSAYIRRQFPHRAREVRPARRGSLFEIDQQSDDSHDFDFVMVSTEDDYPYGNYGKNDTVETLGKEYHGSQLDLRKNVHIMPYFRRLSRYFSFSRRRAVEIRPKQPSSRFRVDSTGASAESSGASPLNTRLGHNMGGDSEDDDADSHYHSLDGNEHEYLISPTERSENHVFLISNRRSFTISTKSSNSHHFKVVPPTPTESSSSHISVVIPPSLASFSFTPKRSFSNESVDTT
ncbi:hypothetical protein H0H93_007684, partial [Arthromyces matolae]